MSRSIQIPNELVVLLSEHFTSERYERYEEAASKWLSLDVQRKNDRFCDTEIKCAEGRTFPAHKCVLASTCSYLDTLFTTPLMHKNSHDRQVIDLTDYSEPCVQALLNLIYSSEADLASVDIPELLRLAEFLQCNGIVSLLVGAFRKTINENSVVLWYDVSLYTGVKRLQTLCQCYVGANIVSCLAVQGIQERVREIANESARDPAFNRTVNFCYNIGQVFVVDVGRKSVEKQENNGCFEGNFQLDADQSPSYDVMEYDVSSYSVSEGRLYRLATYWCDADDADPYADLELLFDMSDIRFQVGEYDQSSKTYKSLTDHVHYRGPSILQMMRQMHKEDREYLEGYVRTGGSLKVSQMSLADGLSHVLVLLSNDVLVVVLRFGTRSGYLAAIDVEIKSSEETCCFVDSKRKGMLVLSGISKMHPLQLMT